MKQGDGFIANFSHLFVASKESQTEQVTKCYGYASYIDDSSFDPRGGDASFIVLWGPQGVLPIMAYTGRLRPKGVPFSGFRYMKG